MLGKKSWNVYNSENIARVKRDEASAAAREAEEEQRTQEVDAQWRLQVLRGDASATKPRLDQSDPKSQEHKIERTHRKRRRIAGEDDTDRDIRFALEDVEKATVQKKALYEQRSRQDAPLTDARGHINLFPVEQVGNQSRKNPEIVKEEDAQKKRLEDQITLRFSNAAGHRQDPHAKPWYSSSAAPLIGEDAIKVASKDVWGNEDLGRRERERSRLVADDPLAMIQRGVTDLRKTEQERQNWNDERAVQLDELKEAQRLERRKRKRRGKDDLISPLALSDDKHHQRHGERNDHHRHHHRHRHRRSRDV